MNEKVYWLWCMDSKQYEQVVVLEDIGGVIGE
jgi:hypothetical protein